MGEYVNSKQDMKFQSIDSLKPVEQVIEEADLALGDHSRTIDDSAIQEAIAGAIGTGIGAGLGFAGLYFGGSVVGLSAAGITSGLGFAGGLIGGGMAAGIGVLAAPALLLGGIGMSVAAKKNREKLKEAKQLIYKNALAQQTAIIKELQEESNSDKDRIDYLTGLNNLLSSAIRDLQYDLGITA